MWHKGAKANPGRDKILCLCIAARMDINEIRRALEISNCAILYARNTPQYPLTHTLTAMNMTPPKLSNTLRWGHVHGYRQVTVKWGHVQGSFYSAIIFSVDHISTS